MGFWDFLNSSKGHKTTIKQLIFLPQAIIIGCSSTRFFLKAISLKVIYVLNENIVQGVIFDAVPSEKVTYDFGLDFYLTLRWTFKQRTKVYFIHVHECIWSFYARILATKDYIHCLCKLLSSTSASQHLNSAVGKWKELWCQATSLTLDIIWSAKYFKLNFKLITNVMHQLWMLPLFLLLSVSHSCF